jgi:hypothetical protein
MMFDGRNKNNTKRSVAWWFAMMLMYHASNAALPLLSDQEASQASVLDMKHFLPADTYSARWIFSGIVSDEKGEQYGYFFQMTRDGTLFHSSAALFDAQTKAVIFQDEEHATLEEATAYHWQVGHAFLRFNAINDSWVFGVKTADKKGFNFKIDMLKQPESSPAEEALRSDVAVVVSQTNSLNGHLHLDDTHGEQFVTAKHAWFRQISMTTLQDVPHLVNGVLCHFDDDSGFYAINLSEEDALQGAMAGGFDAQGLALQMSQFVHVKQLPEGAWDIQVPSPKLHLMLSNYTLQHQMTAGFVSGRTPGFCLLSHENISEAASVVANLKRHDALG